VTVATVAYGTSGGKKERRDSAGDTPTAPDPLWWTGGDY
jgi:hypothetical protein